MTTFSVTIDEDVPLQKKRRDTGTFYIHPLNYVLRKLKVGQSLRWPLKTPDETPARTRNVTKNVSERTGYLFTTRQCASPRWGNGIRIWRTK
jgi:hypothetical protein